MTDNACLLHPDVGLNSFRIITRQFYHDATSSFHYHAYLLDLDLSEEDPAERQIELLLDTRIATEYLRTPAAALAVLLLLTARVIDAQDLDILQ